MRKTFIKLGYRVSQPLYRRAYKTRPSWRVDLYNEALYPQNSLGQALAQFLNKHNYVLMSQFEDHDVTHALTQIPPTILGEIAMQYYLLGNGKRSPYLRMVVIVGFVLYPLHWRLFLNAKQQGQQAYPFHKEDFSRLLHCPIDDLRRCFNIQPYPQKKPNA